MTGGRGAGCAGQVAMDERKGKNDRGVVTPFRRPAKGKAAPEDRDQETTAALRRKHPVTAYVDMLKTEGFITPLEHEKLTLALAGLVEAFPKIKRGAVNAIRREMGRPENNKYVLCDKEKGWWKLAKKKGIVPIPRFDIDKALSNFLVTWREDPDRTVVFLRPEHEQPVPPYIPPSLRMSEVFFYVVLRMFRGHCQRKT